MGPADLRRALALILCETGAAQGFQVMNEHHTGLSKVAWLLGWEAGEGVTPGLGDQMQGGWSLQSTPRNLTPGFSWGAVQSSGPCVSLFRDFSVSSRSLCIWVPDTVMLFCPAGSNGSWSIVVSTIQILREAWAAGGHPGSRLWRTRTGSHGLGWIANPWKGH